MLGNFLVAAELAAPPEGLSSISKLVRKVARKNELGNHWFTRWAEGHTLHLYSLHGLRTKYVAVTSVNSFYYI
jgi:hypothetical protein